MTRRVAWGVAIGGFVLLCLGLAFHLALGQPAPTAAAAKINVGGAFTLVSQDGTTVTDRDFRGKYMLIYFGYTFCPDVYPTTLSTIADALEQLGNDGRTIVPLFITVDPARDTPEHLATYVRYFHPRITGLTGTADQVAKAARAYGVYYAKVPDPSGAPDAYMMDHSSIVFLMGPDGKYLSHFSHDTSASEVAERVRSIVRAAS